MSLKFEVNGQAIETEEDSKKRLLQFLREDLGLVGTKNGCGVGHCGTCTVIIDHEAKRSCVVTLGQCEGKKIETVESLGSGENLHPLQKAFIQEGAVQCGFCTPGMLMSSKALLDKNHHPSIQDIRKALKNNICRCTGYGSLFRAIQRAAVVLYGPYPEEVKVFGTSYDETKEKGNAVGISLVKKDAIPKVTGAKVFADDYTAEHSLYGKVLFSQHAHARIRSINTKEAELMPGVVKVLTAKDVPGLNKFGLFVPQQPVLVPKEVKYFGDCVACVYAETSSQAEAALSKIKVDYEPLPAYISAKANMQEGAPKVHEDTDNNIIHHVAVTKGDVKAGFEAADVIIDNVYQTQSVEHAYLEPEACLALPENGGITIYTGNQGSEAYRKMISENLDIPLDKVRVIFTMTGGGFGGKEEPTVQILASLGAYVTDRPVKMAMTRAESIRMSTKRHPMNIHMRHGATKDGRILAMESYVIGDAGAYISQTNPVIFRSAVTASGPYITENVEANSFGVYTHKNPCGAFRGFGSTQASFACESQMDQIAEAIGMSPYELRKKNAFKEGVETSTGQILKDGIGYLGTLDAVNEALEAMKDKFSHLELPEHIKLGFGIASAYKNVGIGTGLLDEAGAYVELTSEGHIKVSMGSADMGQGTSGIMAQIAAETLDVDFELVDVVTCDTATCPDGGMTTASRQTYVTGNAVKEASALLLQKLSQWTKLSKDLTSEDLKRVWAEAKKAGEGLRIEHVYYPPKTYKHRADANHKPGEDLSTYDIHYAYCFASAAVALTVDTQTGQVHVYKVAAAQDVGKAINPISVIGQIEGAVAMGVGLALSEEYVVDDKKIYTDTLKRLQVPTSENMPEVESIIIEERQEAGPYGAKGMGEVGLNPVAPAVANAIYDAVGVRMKTLPMKPEQILAALKAR